MMFYLFDKSETLIGTLEKGVAEAFRTEMINAPAQLNVVVKPSVDIAEAVYIAHQDRINPKEIHLYRINTPSTGSDGLRIDAIEAGYDDLSADGYIKDYRPSGATIHTVLTTILNGSRWAVGTVNTEKTVTSNFYYMSRLEALRKLIDITGIEIKLRYTWANGAITGRFIDVYEQIGIDTGKRFVHGSDLLSVVREEQRIGIYTALVGRGKGEATDGGGFGRRITFKDVVWTTAGGDPVDKPLNQEHVELPTMTALFGYPDSKPRIGIVEFQEIDDPAVLLQATYERLLQVCRPLVTYRSSVLDIGEIGLGDTVGIIRDDLGIRYKTRINKRVVNLLNPKLTQIELGDPITSFTVNKLANLNKLIDDTAEEFRVTVQEQINILRQEMGNLYWGEDGYNYDLPIGNAYGLPAGLYSFDRPIDQNPTKFVYVGAGKIVISNEKDAAGNWILKTIMDGAGLGTGVVGANQILAGAIMTDHISADGISAQKIVLSSGQNVEESFTGVPGIFSDIPDPLYQVGDIWNQPEAMADYWSDKDLTGQQLVDLDFDGVDMVGGNTYIAIIGRSIGDAFHRSDWRRTGSTDKIPGGIDLSLAETKTELSDLGVRISQQFAGVDLAITDIRAGQAAFVKYTDVDGSSSSTIIDGGVIISNSLTASKFAEIAGFTFSDSTMRSSNEGYGVQISGSYSWSPLWIGNASFTQSKIECHWDGRFKAMDAMIHGTIQATDGYFVGDLKKTPTSPFKMRLMNSNLDPQGDTIGGKIAIYDDRIDNSNPFAFIEVSSIQTPTGVETSLVVQNLRDQSSMILDESECILRNAYAILRSGASGLHFNTQLASDNEFSLSFDNSGLSITYNDGATTRTL